jgi:tetratricopeptide (TPR) repeat protein
MRRSIAIKPNVPFFHMNLGAAFHAVGRFPEAVAAFERGVQLNPNDAAAHHSLGLAHEKLYDYDRARAYYRRAIELDPKHAPSYYNLGVLVEYHGDYDESLRLLEKAIELKPEYALARTSRATDLLRREKFEEGWLEYEWRWRLPQFRQDLPDPKKPIWNGEPLAGRTILLRCEQGMGDTIQFVRYASLVKERGPKKIILLSQPALVRLMQRATGVDEVIAQGTALPPYDVQVPLLSQPRIFKTDIGTIPSSVPYITAEPELAGDANVKVGLVWSSNPGHPLARFRTTTLSAFAPLAQIPGLTFYSLQKGEPAKQSTTPPSGMTVVDRTEELTDFAETAALLANLDLVVTVDTAVAHLAGAMSKRTLTIVPFLSDFRWFLARDDSPWYPTMRLFRLRSMFGWDEAISRVAEALRAMTTHALH